MSEATPDKRELILEAALTVLGRDGISGVTMRAVSREADVALGLATYHFDDKAGLVTAALERIADGDALIVSPGDHTDPTEALSAALHRVADPDLLSLQYLALRLQLWSLAGVDERYASINQAAQRRYLAGLAELIAAARPELDRDDVERRANDILIVQNGVWLTSVLIPEPATVARAIARTETIAFD